MSEKIHHPAHYGGDTKYEAIKVIHAWGCNFNSGNALKYAMRAGLKVDAGMTLEEKLIEDYGKAAWYLRYQRARVLAKCPTACTVQPPVIQDGYTLKEVIDGTGLHDSLRPVLYACCNHNDVGALDAALLTLLTLIGTLK